MAQHNRELIEDNSLRTIILWVIWAGTAVTVYMLLYLDTDLWMHIQTDQSRVTILIIGLFLVGVAISFIVAVYITNEAMQVVELGNMARGSGLPGINPKGSYFAVQRFFIALKEIMSSNGQPDIDALIDLELGDYHRRNHTVEVMGNLLITLGLIGTVVGLTMTLTGLTTSLDALGVDQERLMRGLESAMGGMGTAFYTTLLGAVLGGVLLRVFALITGNGLGNISDTLKKICMVYCAADVKPSLERDMRALNAEVTLLGDNVQTLRAALSDTKLVMNEFHAAARQLNHLSDEDEREKTLRDSVVLQMYYSNLLKEEIKVLNKINRSWWTRLRQSMQRTRAVDKANGIEKPAPTRNPEVSSRDSGASS